MAEAGRRLARGPLVIASHNAGKVGEIAALLAPFGIEAVAASALALAEPAEVGATFAANARIKAEGAARAARLPALADDSGLVVAALGGEPGVRSARWAGAGRDFAGAMVWVNEALAGSDDRRARFVCALALAWPDDHVETFVGKVAGTLVWPPRGTKGFGYDPIFVPAGESRTFAEMDPAEKDAISHRVRAFAKLVAACLG